MRCLKSFWFMVLMAFMHSIFADVATNSLNQLLQNFQSMQADFTQIVSDSSGGLSSQQEGSVLIHKPNQFRWKVMTPNEQIYISDGTTLWNIEPDLDQVIRSSLTQNLSTTPLLLLSGNVSDINSVFKVTQIGDGQYRLVPIASDSLIKEVDLTFSTGVISRITVLNTMGQTAVVDFINVQFNVSIPASTFNYVPRATQQVLTQ